DGKIHAFNPATGAFLGTLLDSNGNPISIDGLWALTVGNAGAGVNPNAIYFSAGIDDEMLTIDPPPAAFMTGIANFMPRKTPRALTAISRSQAAVSNRSSTALPLSPASLTRMSGFPTLARVASTVAFHSALLLTWTWRHS